MYLVNRGHSKKGLDIDIEKGVGSLYIYGLGDLRWVSPYIIGCLDGSGAIGLVLLGSRGLGGLPFGTYF